MARICIVTPARAGARNGNRHTAQRWAGFLRALGHRVSVAVQWDRKPCDLLLALHARRSHPSIVEFRAHCPGKPLVVALTGTDLYRDLPGSRKARESLRMAKRIIVLQSEAKLELDEGLRRKTRIVYQSADPSIRHAPPKGRFRVAVVGHLREEKDPFRAALALQHLKRDLEVVQIGDALSPPMANAAKKYMKRDRRYRWLGGRTHAQALGWIARSHVLVVSSVMEGGANVISEAACIGTPVIASRVSGNVGMLGRTYPGYFSLFDEKELGKQIENNIGDKKHYRSLEKALAARRRLFAPSAERGALAGVVREALGRRA
ncbi:MAG: TIGR04348 family glycosyltransferase [Betaproteobacteria bacterium]|nr:TIGR04348 family glycosyltransferase [Betaproteobacteria bacterium]